MFDNCNILESLPENNKICEKTSCFKISRFQLIVNHRQLKINHFLLFEKQ